MIEAVCFDAFGTLCEIEDKRQPYRPIIEAWPSGPREAYRAIMTRDVSPATLAREAGLSEKVARTIEENVAAEIASMTIYPDAVSTLEILLGWRRKWAIVSNLAKPYSAPLLQRLPFVPDVCAWSYTVGCPKPEEGIYLYACKELGVEPSEVLMVGDSLRNDYEMPRRLGMEAHYLRRLNYDPDIPGCVMYLDEIVE